MNVFFVFSFYHLHTTPQSTIVRIKIYKFVQIFLFDISKVPDVIQEYGSDIWNQHVPNTHNPLFNQKIQKNSVAKCYLFKNQLTLLTKFYVTPTRY